MARERSNTANGDNPAGQAADPEAGGGTEKAKIADGMRPLYNEIARLSATLAQARQAAFNGDPARSVRALALLQEQTGMAVRFAELMVPAEV